jgi:nitroreductase
VSRESAQDQRLELLHARRTVAQLIAPGPDATELAALLAAADTAPDHGRLHPWRFLVLNEEARERLSDAYAKAQAERDPDPEVVARAAAKPLRGPCVVAAFARTVDHPRIPAWEQLVAAGCAVHNLCLAATALGFGSAWRTGWFVTAPQVRAALGAADDEQVIGLIHLGSPRPQDEPS